MAAAWSPIPPRLPALPLAWPAVLIQFWLFATPIAYPSSLLSQPWRTVYGLNPMVGVVEGFRWALLGSGAAPGPVLAVSALAALLLLFTGIVYFRRMEATFADVI